MIVVCNLMAKKSKKKTHLKKPTHGIILGSSNNKIVHTLSSFCLPIKNHSEPGGQCRVGYKKSYLSQALPIDRSAIYVLLLSFNGVLKKECQIDSLHLSFVKRVLQTIQVLSTYSLNVRKNLIIGLPLVRFNASLYPQQLAEIRKLEKILTEKNIFFFNILDQIPESIRQSDYFELKLRNGFLCSDGIHYSHTVKRITSQVTANALKEFYKSRW